MLAKHTKNLSLVDILAVGVDRMQRNFEPMRKQVEAWKETLLVKLKGAPCVRFQPPHDKSRIVAHLEIVHQWHCGKFRCAASPPLPGEWPGTGKLGQRLAVPIKPLARVAG